ncbi:MAG: type II toxin-antitoxin system PemK/MazF family toxin [Candidatus Saccharimonadales bacterium]
MVTFTVGDVVLIAFPYADFTKFKKRPALVVAHAEFENLILCQITSKANTSTTAIPIKIKDFKQGGLGLDSYIRPDKLFTVEQSVILSTIGSLKLPKINKILSDIREIFT